MKILVIRFSSIGDIVLTSPVVRCLSNQVPDAEVHYVTKARFAGLVTGNPHIRTVHILEDSLFGLAKKLRGENFDYIVDLHNNIRSFILTALLAKPYRRVDKRNKDKREMVRLKKNIAVPHVVERNLKAAGALGVKDDGKGLDYWFPGDEPTLAFLPKPFALDEFTAFVLAAQHSTKQLPREKAFEVANEIRGKVILLGGPEEAALGQWIEDNTGSRVLSLCGNTSLPESAAIVKNAKRVITNDTGLMHIAAAFQKDIVSVWGNTVPDFGMTPWFGLHGTGTNRIAEVKNLYCRPCSRIGYSKCPEGHFRCMWEQDPREICR